MIDETKGSNSYRKRVPVYLSLGIVVALAALSLTLLVMAQDPPVNVVKTAVPDAVFPGEIVLYTAAFDNPTDTNVDLVLISDTLPTGFMYLALGPTSDILDDPTGTTETIVWDGGPYTVPAYGSLELSYYVLADYSGVPIPQSQWDSTRFAEWMTAEIGVAVVPGTVFYSQPGYGDHSVRFAFPKKLATLQAARERMANMLTYS